MKIDLFSKNVSYNIKNVSEYYLWFFWYTPKQRMPYSGLKKTLGNSDEEYRSEEALLKFAKILAQHRVNSRTVLFAIDPATL